MIQRSQNYCDFMLDVKKGLVKGHSLINKFGLNPDIDTGSAPEDVWGGSGLYTGFADSAEIISIVSSSANDTSAGTGARTIEVFGLDSDFNEISETVTLNGTTPVLTANSYIRMNRGIVRTAGTGGSNAGGITAKQSVTVANVMFVIALGRNQTNVAVYTVPAGKTGYLFKLQVNVSRGGNTSCNFDFIARPFGQVFQSKSSGSSSTNGGFYTREGSPWQVLTEKTDVTVRVDTVSANNTQVSAYFDIILVDNP